MPVSKEQIYNLALSSLLLSKEIAEISTNTTNEVRVLNTHYDIAFESTLQDLDLDSLSTPIVLELLEELDTVEPWDFVYKYPTNCVFLRRLVTNQVTDNARTHIAKATGLFKGQKAIFTNKVEAVASCIPLDVPLAALSVMAALTVAYSLAFLSAPLLVGKGAAKLRKDIRVDYVDAKTEAQETDMRENFRYEAAHVRSEFVAERMS